MQLWIARSARETSQTGLADPANLPRATRTRKLRARKKMSVPLKPQQKTNHPSINTRKVVSTTGKTNAKTPGSRMKKTPRKKLHWDTKANRCRRIRRILTTTIMMTTEPVPSTKPATAMATEEVTVTPAPEEALRNGCGSWSRARYRKRLVIWQRPKHHCRQNRKKPEVRKSKNKIARKGKAAKNLVKNFSKTAGRKSGGLLRVQQPKPLGRLGRIW